MKPHEIVVAMTKWWESDGWIEGDARKRGIDHSLDWSVIVAKVLDMASPVEEDDDA
jgi:hypothetical protein